ncbi:DsbA family protein [Candidatus Peregrinibacteria bacterium]|nr:DsbA family protein [Candidatus Peregrinibacteria bacterium]
MRKTVCYFFILFSFLILAGCSPADQEPRPVLGDPGASVLVEEFSDFECPACGQVGPALEQLIRLNPDLARLEFHHFPLSYHQNAFRAAEAAECAADQGKFWEFSELNFKNQKNLTDDALKSFADYLKLDRTSFDTCFDGNEKRARIKADIQEGLRRQLSYTPSLYVNGQLVQWGGAEEFDAYLKSLKE